jgi:hypothetical protein
LDTFPRKKGRKRKNGQGLSQMQSVGYAVCYQHAGDCAGAELDLPWLLCVNKIYFKGHHRIQFSLVHRFLLFSRENKEREKGGRNGHL